MGQESISMIEFFYQSEITLISYFFSICRFPPRLDQVCPRFIPSGVLIYCPLPLEELADHSIDRLCQNYRVCKTDFSSSARLLRDKCFEIKSW